MSSQRVAILTTSTADDLVFGSENTFKGTFTEVARIDNGSAFFSVTGEIRATGDIISYYSDARLKDNIIPIGNALDKVMKLNGVSFDWNGLSVESRRGKHDVGLIAQEVAEVVPEAVTEPWAMKDGDEKYISVNYEKLVPVLVQAIKEQQLQIDELKMQVKQLMGN
jgi:hypothetical protein